MKDYAQTGFQSACSEFSESSLSLDEHFGIKDPAIKIVKIKVDAPLFGINKNDLLLIDMNKRPRSGDLIIVSNSGINGIYRFEFQDGNPVLWPGKIRLNMDEQFILAPIFLVIKELVPLSHLDQLRLSPTYLNNHRKQESAIRWNLMKKKKTVMSE